MANGLRDLTNFVCVEKILYDCGPLSIKHGFIDITGVNMSSIAKAVIYCEAGFTQEGDTTTYCKSNGSNWTGKDKNCGEKRNIINSVFTALGGQYY